MAGCPSNSPRWSAPAVSACSAGPGCPPSPGSRTTAARSGAARRVDADDATRRFTRDPAARQRYWARSHLGWRHDRRRPRRTPGTAPSPSCERAGLLTGIVTQNVDGLHQAAGPRQVIELHGSLAGSCCLAAASGPPLRELDAPAARRPTRAGPRAATAVNPDGDVELADDDAERFRRRRTAAACGGAAQAGCGVLRRERPAGRGSRRASRCVERARRAARARLLADGDVRPPVRPARGGAGHPGRDRQPGRDPRRPARRSRRRRPARRGASGAGRQPAAVLPVHRMGSMIGGTAREGLHR